MFETGYDQARGLAAWELRPPTRVVPVVAGGTDASRQHTLSLLWALEQGLQQQGHAVVVIDGLNGLQPRDALLGHRAVLRRWLQGVPAGSVVLLHASLEALASLLGDSVARPLVAMAADKHAMVHAYQAVKVLWQAAGLQTVVVQQADNASPALNDRAEQALRQACERCLGMVPSLWRLEYDEQTMGSWARPHNDACLLKVLDSALMIDDSGTQKHVDPCFERRQQSTADQIIGVSDVHRQRHA
ncbi:MAG TPA: hypothetical protein VFY31_04210 [Macromonas sp.]|nr:hypothetical protein [Macromonas sp.]